MIDHITLRVRNVEASHAFYVAALAPLGYVDKVRHGSTVGMGTDDGTPRADFYISPREQAHDANSAAVSPIATTSPITHVAFRAHSEQQVRDFYAAALAAGGIDNGKPGLREYHPGYFAAFVLDPDGNNIEAVTDWSASHR
jgi:catechol 2,3-dioxygenase-like lactoylglutathione lyase family enzyme